MSGSHSVRMEARGEGEHTNAAHGELDHVRSNDKPTSTDEERGELTTPRTGTN